MSKQVRSPTADSGIWYRVRLTSEQIAAGCLTRIREQFALAVRDAGEPDGACLFAAADEPDSGETEGGRDDATPELFFSPRAISLVPLLLGTHGARPSHAPERSRAVLLVGRPADWKFLPCPTH